MQKDKRKKVGKSGKVPFCGEKVVGKQQETPLSFCLPLPLIVFLGSKREEHTRIGRQPFFDGERKGMRCPLNFHVDGNVSTGREERKRE